MHTPTPSPGVRIAARTTHSVPVGKSATAALYVLGMVVVVVGVDILFFRHHFWERLSANVGIVLVFAAFYFRFLHRS